MPMLMKIRRDSGQGHENVAARPVTGGRNGDAVQAAGTPGGNICHPAPPTSSSALLLYR